MPPAIDGLKSRLVSIFQSGVARRLAHGTALNASGQVAVICSQLILPPVLIRVWGFELFSIWLILMTIPAWVAILDLGFGAAAGNAILERIARGERAEAQSAFSILIYFNLAMVCLLALVSWIGLSAWVAAFASILHVGQGVVAPIIPLMLVTALLSILASSLFNACRAVGGYLSGTAVNVLFLFLDPILVASTALIGAGPRGAAAMLAMSAAVRSAVLLTILARANTGLSFAPAYVDGLAFRKMLPLALSAFALPATTVVNLQATLIIVTQTFGLSAGAAFALVRTLSRVNFQAVSVIVRSSLVDYTSAVAGGQRKLVRQIEHIIRLAVALIILPGVAVFVLLGPMFVKVWSHGEVVFPGLGYLLVGIGIAAHVVWNVDLMLLIALNRHQRIAAILISVQLASIAVVWACAQVAGFEVVLAIMAASDVVICVFVLRGRSLTKWPAFDAC